MTYTKPSDFQDQLVRGLTHRMNNILSLFHGYLGMILDEKTLDPETVSGLARIKEGARAASELMDRTKALAKPSSVVWRQVAPEQFLQILKAGLEPADERGVTIAIECDDKMPSLWTDTSRLRTALSEVIQNACDASQANGTVTLRAHTESEDGKSGKGVPPIKWICFSVTNQGEAIKPEVAQRIFQPFFSTKPVQKASGLGLTVAQELVHQLGGVIRFTSEPGATTFRLLLPSRVEGF